MYTLDISGHDDNGMPGINRFGGLFLTPADALKRGRAEAARGRLHFHPDVIWVRDEEGDVVELRYFGEFAT